MNPSRIRVTYARNWSWAQPTAISTSMWSITKEHSESLVFFWLPFWIAYPSPKAEVFEHPEHLLVNAPAPERAESWPSSKASSELGGVWKSRGSFCWHKWSHGIRMDTLLFFFNPKICKDLPLQLQDVRVHVCGCLQLQLVVTEAGGRNLYTRYLQYNNIVAYCNNYNLPTDLWFMIIQPNRIAQSSKAAELWR